MPVYKDNAANRKLDRVGKTYGYKATGGVAPKATGGAAAPKATGGAAPKAKVKRVKKPFEKEYIEKIPGNHDWMKNPKWKGGNSERANVKGDFKHSDPPITVAEFERLGALNWTAREDALDKKVKDRKYHYGKGPLDLSNRWIRRYIYKANRATSHRGDFDKNAPVDKLREEWVKFKEDRKINKGRGIKRFLTKDDVYEDFIVQYLQAFTGAQANI
jgi:hypothetical protein|tara:strand:+ start:401 stop:1048 length:648 start_codon:yes stop_codon:yes gene_type:complete